MLFAFIDESYVAGEVHLVSALVLTPEQLSKVEAALEERQ